MFDFYFKCLFTKCHHRTRSVISKMAGTRRRQSKSSSKTSKEDVDQRPDESEQLTQKQAFVTISPRLMCLLLLSVIPSLALYCVSSWLQTKPYHHGNHEAVHKVNPSQDVDIHQPYNLENHVVQIIREENMKKYSYNYDREGIDFRRSLSTEEFYDVYDGKWPVIISDVVPSWPAFNWSKEFLLKTYGKEQITLRSVDGSLSSAVGLTMPLERFVSHLHEGTPERWSYLEDELFLYLRPELKADVGNCDYLAEDYFQLFPLEVRPWNSMMLWGTAHSRSTLHIDPYNWTGTNAVIKGRKKWKLYPPGQDHLLSILPDRRSGFPLDSFKYNSALDAFNIDPVENPDYARVKEIEFEQKAGDLLIIPTGWLHQAYNVEETLAVSSQVMNRNNYRVVLEEVLKANPEIKRGGFPDDFSSLPPDLQVKTVMDFLPREVLQRGQEVTDRAVEQLHKSYHELRKDRHEMSQH